MTTFQGEGSYDITKRYLLILFKSAHCLKEKKTTATQYLVFHV